MYPENVIWYVMGADTGLSWPIFFASKQAAEKHAAKWFPNEPHEKRNARVMFRKVLTEAEV